MSLWGLPLQRFRRWACKLEDERQESESRKQWFLLAGRSEEHIRESPDPKCLTPIYPPDDAFWADPFIWARNGRYYVFFEDFRYCERRGRISVLSITGEGRPEGPPIPVIDEPHHLSYPFLFEFGGELHMVPEAAATERVDLYRCVAFPERWRYVRTLLCGFKAADATLFEHGGRWWLFCSAKIGRARLNNSLFAFFSNSPISDHWTPHPGNPLVLDFARGRPGGRIFESKGGRLLRPSQNCVPRYGYGINLNEIQVLTADRYSERRIWQATGNAAGGWQAMHHLDWHRGLMVMDAQRLLPIDANP